MYKYQNIIDLLAEARRFAASHPDEARNLHLEIRHHLMEKLPASRFLERLLQNLLEGQRALHVDPDVFKGYCTGAIHELECLGTVD